MRILLWAVVLLALAAALDFRLYDGFYTKAAQEMIRQIASAGW